MTTSNCQPCQGQVIVVPHSVPVPRGPPWCGHRPSIAWNVPHFRLGKDYVLGIDVLKKALWVHPFSEDLIRDIQPELEGYHTTKRSFQLPIDQPLNVELVREVVTRRLAELGG